MGRSKEFEETIVLQKAMELFWQQGFEKTSMSELVEHMGIHRKSIYDTFGDKHSLYLKVIDHYAEYTTARLTAITMKSETAYLAIQAIFDYIIEGNEEKQSGCLFVNAATEIGAWDKEIDEKIGEAFKKEEGFLAVLLQEGQAKGEISNKYDAKILSEILHTTLLGLRVLVRTSASKEKMHEIGEFYLSLLNL